MTTHYRAVQISSPGQLELVARARPTPGPQEVLIAVEACGICGADRSDIEHPSALPRVPGHEVVGRIVALGDQVPVIWALDQRVGVGRFGGHCQTCRACRSGKFHLCRNQPVMGASCDGGYAEMMLARHTGLVSIPEELGSEEAAPILCAGIATFNALRKCGAGPGDTVAVLGIGGLGHMAVQYARRMGFRVVAIGRGAEVAADALALGAHHYVDSRQENPAKRLASMGGASAILATLNDASAISEVAAGLAPEGRLVVLGVGSDPLAVSLGHLVGGERGIIGSITGSPHENEKTLDFSVLAGVRPMIETIPLEAAEQAYQRLHVGEARYRIVLTMKGNDHAHQ